MITIVPFDGPLTGVVFAVRAVPSGSESPAFVKSPVAGTSSFVVTTSLSTIGASFTGVTVTVIVSFVHATPGVPASQIETTMMSVPLKFAFGVYVYVPSGLITIVPFVGPFKGVVFAVSAVPSGSESPAFVKSPDTGVSSGVLLISLSTIGASFTAFTVMLIVSFTHTAGKGRPASQIDTTTTSVPLKFGFGV